MITSIDWEQNGKKDQKRENVIYEGSQPEAISFFSFCSLFMTTD